MVSELQAVLQKINVTSNIIYVGWSFGMQIFFSRWIDISGGLNAQLYGLQYLDQISGLVLIDPVSIDQMEEEGFSTALLAGQIAFYIVRFEISSNHHSIS